MEEITEIRNTYFKLKGGTFNFKGKSMEPTLKEGDEVMAMPVKPEDIKTGEIIVFGNNVLGCHRVLGRFKKDGKLYFWEKGDNHGVLRFISEDDIIGKVQYLIAKGKFKKPPLFAIKGNLPYYMLDFFTYFYIKLSRSIIKFIFFGKRNKLSAALGTFFWRLYYLCFRLIQKR